ncbi:MAG: heterodisulfide reductase-related iron-sulfur binding cluster [Gammaproteobacteria bacterium]|jgi:Fe-S oxidoreductase|nr:heterodisulfide reductase-related iron-sulfur binding cluster [Gammaproteobacteria bacterium]MDP6616344.1 heterodisulfide reductase-related iron-sulfur binding cluster [Gammaproteobacteria bacterium]MDP6695900.1 heterodisulfide reductase-related iron-sulfur binding cluster [Gammaproteobacteria bacterium]MDP7041365.1 heterodisulfide reductase-related iron-sulfur binding cluster [Gammaproteobacteria bacterium]
MSSDQRREGSLEAPTRHPLDWQSDKFYDAAALEAELERVFDVCHGCRRCFNLCNAFPTLFDAVDESDTGELDSVPKEVFRDVTDECYLCDMCFMSKCPYVPPHEWNIDFPHLMLRAKAARFKKEGAPLRDRILAATDTVGNIAGIPVVAGVVNSVNRSAAGRKLLEQTLGVDTSAPVPEYHRNTGRKRVGTDPDARARGGTEVNGTSGRVVLFATCYGDRNSPQIVEDLVRVFEHNGIPVALVEAEQCCGMPKLELGDLAGVVKLRSANIGQLLPWAQDGWDLVAPVPSCVLMFRQELPLMFPDDADVQAVGDAFYDPFEYLHLRHRGEQLNVDFKNPLGKVSYQVPCHLRVQNIGLKTRDVLQLIPDTTVDVIERCSGHDGTYGVKKRFRQAAVKIARPVVRQVGEAGADHFTSDCPMAGAQIDQLLPEPGAYLHPLSLLRKAYGI